MRKSGMAMQRYPAAVMWTSDELRKLLYL